MAKNNQEVEIGMIQSMEIDLAPCKDEFQEKLFNLTRSRQSLSLFDLDIGDSNKYSNDKEIEEKLQTELTEWHQLIQNAKSNVEKMSNEQENSGAINRSILAPFQMKYLEEMPDLQTFLKDSVKFQVKAYNYLQDYSETLEMKEDLDNYCEQILRKIVLDKSDKYIY